MISWKSVIINQSPYVKKLDFHSKNELKRLRESRGTTVCKIVKTGFCIFEHLEFFCEHFNLHENLAESVCSLTV